MRLAPLSIPYRAVQRGISLVFTLAFVLFSTSSFLGPLGPLASVGILGLAVLTVVGWRVDLLNADCVHRQRLLKAALGLPDVTYQTAVASEWNLENADQPQDELEEDRRRQQREGNAP